jgi:hypothetical protein
LALVRALARGRIAEHRDPTTPEVVHRDVEIVDIQGDVVSADVAVYRDRCALAGGGVVEHLEHRLLTAAEETVLPHRRAGVHAQMLAHPVAVIVKGAQRVEVLAAEHVDEES